jgi:glycosyltransferase involved in cell wall biosynthesis
LSRKSISPLKVLLVAPNFHNAIGILARYIVKNCPNIEFFLVDVNQANSAPEKFMKLVQSVDVVHWLVNLSTAQLIEPDLPARIPCPTVATIHHVAPDEQNKISAANVADVIHVSCGEWLNFVTPLTQTPVRMAYYPVDLSRYKPNRSMERAHTPFRIGFLGVGSLFHRKRLDVLLKALDQLQSYGEKFQLWTQSLYWPEVTVPGDQAQLLKFAPFYKSWRSYSKFDVYVCCSDVEGGPLTVLEALASQVPVISTPVGLVPEVLSFGGGLIVEKSAPEKLSEALAYLMHNPDKYLQLKRETLPAVQQFVSSVNKQYIDLYADAIAYWEKKHQSVWTRKPALGHWKTRRQRFFMLGHDLIREARNLRALGQQTTAFFTLLQIGNPSRLFE